MRDTKSRDPDSTTSDSVEIESVLTGVDYKKKFDDYESVPEHDRILLKVEILKPKENENNVVALDRTPKAIERMLAQPREFSA